MTRLTHAQYKNFLCFGPCSVTGPVTVLPGVATGDWWATDRSMARNSWYNPGYGVTDLPTLSVSKDRNSTRRTLQSVKTAVWWALGVMTGECRRRPGGLERAGYRKYKTRINVNSPRDLISHCPEF